MPFASFVLSASPAGFATPLLALVLPQGDLPASLAAVDESVGGGITRLLAARDFAGRKDETAVLYPAGGSTRILLIGIGKAGEVDRSRIRRAAAIAARRAQTLGVPSAAFHLPAEARGSVTPRDAGQAIAEGLGQGAWQFLEMKQAAGRTPGTLERVDVLIAAAAAEFEAGHATGAAIAAGQTLARGVQVLPSNICTPSYLAGVAEDLGRRHGITAHGARPGGDRGRRDARADGRSAGKRRGTALDRARVPRRRGRAHCACGQGRDVRYRRHLDQAGRRAWRT